MLAAVMTADGTWAGAAGIDGPDKRRATAQDEFYIASVTKLFTATLVMHLAAAGKIDLDSPLASYMGDLKVNTNGSTVRQALGMRSGLADYGTGAAALIGADPRHHWTPQQVVAQFVPPSVGPGSDYIYANPNYVLLGVAVEHVTGVTLEAALRSEVLDPVGARRIIPQGSDGLTPKPWALPIGDHLGALAPADFGRDGVISFMSSVSFAGGSGLLASDAPSLAAWTWHLFAGDVIDDASLHAMLPVRPDLHGLGIEELSGLGDRYVVGQTGAKTGYGSILAVFPDEQAVVVVLVNDPDFIVEPWVVQLLEAVTGS